MTKAAKWDRTTGYFKKNLETLPPRKRRERLHRKLQEIIRYAYRSSPAVRAKLASLHLTPKDFQTIRDLEKLPITKKTDLIDLQKRTPPFGGFATVPISELRRIHVSPGPIYEPGERDYHELGWCQALFAAGFRPGDIAINTFSYHMVPFALHMVDNSLSQLRCVIVPTGVGNTEQQVHILRALKVTGFCGTPTFLLTIAEKAEEMGLDLKCDLNLQVGFVAAEMLPESLRSQLESKFGMTIRQGYGTADIGCLGYECMEKNGMHVPDDKIVEIVDPETGKQLEPGRAGEIVATTFNRVYPLIRLGTGDLSILTDERCPCGRTSPRLLRILGRIDQATKVRGLFIHPGQADEIASRHPQIEKYQVVITRRDQKDIMTFRIELKEGTRPSDELGQKIQKTIRDVSELRGEVEFVPAGAIPPGAKKIEDQRIWE